MNRSTTTLARGCRSGPKGMLKSVCLFDEDTHDLIRSLAAKHGVSFAEQVRILVEWGLEAAAEQSR